MMKTLKAVLLLFCILFPQILIGQYTKSFDSISVKGYSAKDTLCLSIVTDISQYQLSFLMQGICICIKDSDMHTVALLRLPNAEKVREKIKHHPNEVKAMHRHTGNEVRPDLEPLVSALNETINNAEDSTGNKIECSHNIYVNKELGLLGFSIRLPQMKCIQANDTMSIIITSRTTEHQEEFSGRYLSHENHRQPRGLGHAPDIMTDTKRNVYIQKKVIIGELLDEENLF